MKGNIPFNRTGIPHTEETKKKLRIARKGRQPNKPKEMVGKRFGRWIVLKYIEGTSPLRYSSRCDCGIERSILGSSLRNGSSKSCGCLQKEKIAERNKGNSWAKGREPWCKGKKRPEHSNIMKGNGNPNWRGGITPENRKFRNSEMAKLWKAKVFKRDKWICQKCNQGSNKLRVHHIQNFSQYPELRFEISNGITFCNECHKEFHRTYGIKNNSREQIKEFLCQNYQV